MVALKVALKVAWMAASKVVTKAGLKVAWMVVMSVVHLVAK